MSSKFLNSIIEEEQAVFGVKNETLKSAAKDVARSYSRSALNKGLTYLDYNKPPNRCAYLYKYGAIHTALVTKYFRKLVKVKTVKKVLENKPELKVVCLGGGPGTDVVGIFKSLSVLPKFHKKIVRVTILDICGGWRNSFKRIIASLCLGQVQNVPSSFIDISKFKAELIQVDLLNPLPSNIKGILSDADIVCMIKFVSAILGKPTSLNALRDIGETLKPNSVVLFIDNFQGNVSKPVEDLSSQAGLQIVLGPLHESFPGKHRKDEKGKQIRYGFFNSKEKKEIFGCGPLFSAKVSVIGFIKGQFSHIDLIQKENSGLVSNACEDDGWDTESETEEDTVSSKTKEGGFQKLIKKDLDKKFCHKFSQTEEKFFNCSSVDSDVDDLSVLCTSLKKLLDVVSQWKNQTDETHCCHCSHRL